MRKAIVDDTAGTTRDRHYGTSDWNGREFSVIDTGGYALGGEDVFEEEIRKQVLLAIDESDVVIFMVEVATGITDLDMVVADLLRRSAKRCCWWSIRSITTIRFTVRMNFMRWVWGIRIASRR